MAEEENSNTNTIYKSPGAEAHREPSQTFKIGLFALISN